MIPFTYVTVEMACKRQSSHHSCGFLFRVLHDDGNLLFDIPDKPINNTCLGVQNGAANVDAVKRSYICYTDEHLGCQ